MHNIIIRKYTSRYEARFNKNHNGVSVLFAKFTNSGHTFVPHDGGGGGAGGAGGAQSLLCVVRIH